MNRDKLLVLLTVIGLAILFGVITLLPSPGLALIIFGVLLAAIAVVTVNLLYAILSLEMGYYSGGGRPKRPHDHAGRALEYLKALLHVRMLRHH